MTVTKQVSIHGKRVFLTKDDQLVARNGIVAGGDDKPSIVFPSPDTVAVFDDFLTDGSGIGISDTGGHLNAITDTGVAGQFFYAKCTDTGIKGALVAGTNGVYRITSSATIATATIAGSSKGIVGKQLAWKANQGPGGQSGKLRFAARIKASAYPTPTSGDWSTIFVGFTDTVAHEFPIYDTGSSDTGGIANAADAVGFMWGTGGDTGWRGVSARGGAAGRQEVTLTTAAPTDNKWTTLELEVHRGISDTGGTVTFFIDGVPKGSITSPVTTNVALTPCAYFADTGGANTFDIDWINVSAPRDTGL